MSADTDSEESETTEMVKLNVKVPKSLLDKLDEIATDLDYSNRSEYIRAVLRETAEPVFTPEAQQRVAQGYADLATGRTVSHEELKERFGVHSNDEQKPEQTKDSGEHNLQPALSEIDRMASALGVSRSVREVASVIYRRSLAEDLIHENSIEGVATSALYAACRKEGIPRSLEEISEVSRVNRKEIGRTYRYISQELGLEVRPVDPKKYVPRFCSELTLSEEVQTKANNIIETTTEKGLLSGKSPTGYAAAAIYAASLLCNEKKTQHEIADVAQVTEATLRNRYQDLIQAMGIDEKSEETLPCLEQDQ